MQEEIKTRVVCDRCKKVIDGMETISDTPPNPSQTLVDRIRSWGLDEKVIIASGGYYKRKGWKQYMDESEGIVCDECMWKDPTFRNDYPTSPVMTPPKKG